MKDKKTAADFLSPLEVERVISERGFDPARIPCVFIKTHTDGPEHFRVFDEVVIGPAPEDIRKKMHQPLGFAEKRSLYGVPAQQIYRAVLGSDW